MSTVQTISMTYRSPADALFDAYWIRIEQEAVDETATVADAAAVLDALYQTDACNSSSSDSDSTAADSAEDTPSLPDAVAQTMDFSYCRDADGSVTVDIKVVRSHLAEPYTLRLQGGKVMTTVIQEDLVTVRKEIEATLVLDYPVVSSISCVPEPLARVGNTLRFAADQVGRSMVATYRSQWDLVTVKVAGVNGEVGSCRALAFHHGVVADVDLEVSAASDDDLSLCPTVKWDADTDYEVTCYKEVLVSRRCTCSETEVDSYTYQQVVPCPNREIRCPGVLRQCMHFLGTELAIERVNCEGDSYVGPGSTVKYKIGDPAYYRRMCCQEPPSNLPQCPTRKTTYQGTIPLEQGEAFWRSIYGPSTRFVPVAPAGGICGEWIIRQVVRAGNCCDGVPALAWDKTISPEVMTPDAVVTIAVTGGGVYPYVWEVTGNGYQFPNGSRRITTTSRKVNLSALPVACGAANITVSDGCSVAHGQVRSTSGAWRYNPDLDGMCVAPGMYQTSINPLSTEYINHRLVRISGMYRVSEMWRSCGVVAGYGIGQEMSEAIYQNFCALLYEEAVRNWVRESNCLEVPYPKNKYYPVLRNLRDYSYGYDSFGYLKVNQSVIMPITAEDGETTKVEEWRC